MDIIKVFGTNLRMYRQSAKLSQEKLAQALEIPSYKLLMEKSKK